MYAAWGYEAFEVEGAGTGCLGILPCNQLGSLGILLRLFGLWAHNSQIHGIEWSENRRYNFFSLIVLQAFQLKDGLPLKPYIGFFSIIPHLRTSSQEQEARKASTIQSPGHWLDLILNGFLLRDKRQWQQSGYWRFLVNKHIP